MYCVSALTVECSQGRSRNPGWAADKAFSYKNQKTTTKFMNFGYNLRFYCILIESQSIGFLMWFHYALSNMLLKSQKSFQIHSYGLMLSSSMGTLTDVFYCLCEQDQTSEVIAFFCGKWPSPCRRPHESSQNSDNALISVLLNENSGVVVCLLKSLYFFGHFYIQIIFYNLYYLSSNTQKINQHLYIVI